MRRTFRRAAGAVVTGILAAILLVLGSWAAGLAPAPVSRLSPERRAVAEAVATAPFRFFSPQSFWNQPVPAAARLDPSSGPVVAHLGAEIADELAERNGPWISTTSYSVPIYTVGPARAPVYVRLTPKSPAPALQAAFAKVPLPPRARPSEGTDGNLVVWQPSSDRLWEFWRFKRTPTGPEASWGGAIDEVSASAGVYGPEAWPGAKPWWGSSASSLSIAGGLITLEDLQQGRINHALAIAVPNVRGGVFSSPAQRSDGDSPDPLALPEGAHLRLDPRLDVAALHLPRTTRLIAEAAQRYGIFVRDGATVVHFFAQDPVTSGGNPYEGPDGYFEGRYPRELLSVFPWDRLQLLKMELHPAG